MRKDAGFSLIEVMVTIAIIGILTGIVSYNYLSGMPQRRVQKSARELYGGIQTARSEAVKRGENVSIVFGVSGYTILDADNNTILNQVIHNSIQVYQVTGDAGTRTYTFNARGMKDGASGQVDIRYVHDGALTSSVRVTSVGGISII